MHLNRRILLTALPAVMLLAVITPSITPAASASSYTIAFLPKAIGNPYFDIAFKGAKEAAKKNGDKVIQVGPTTADASQQVTYINSLIQQRVNAIAISADDAKIPVPALQKAMRAGIKVVSYDSDVAAAGRSVFLNQASTVGIGRIQIDIVNKLLKGKGQIAILSAAASATNQNAWIAVMKKYLKQSKFKNLKLVTTVYGNDDPALSTTVAQGLLQKYPKLRAIIAPTTVGIKAAAQVVDVAKKKGKVYVTGLGTPNDMRKYVKNGTVPEFALWNPGDLGYLAEFAAHDLITGKLKAKVGATFVAGKLGKKKVGAGGVVLLGKPYIFDKTNIDKFNF